MTSRTLGQVYIRMSLAYVCKLDHVYADPYPENPINTKTEQNQIRHKT